MKPIIFARIARMKYYRGITDDDVPYCSMSYVEETGDAHEKYNFVPIEIEGVNEPQCLGFVMVQKFTQIRIENIIGCELFRNKDIVEDVTVVFCSERENGKNHQVVGFFKHAKVYRYPCICTFDDGYEQSYYFSADAKDCVLVPYQERYKHSEWFVPSASDKDYKFGFGRSNIWFAKDYENNPKLKSFLERIIETTDNYNGENDLWKVLR